MQSNTTTAQKSSHRRTLTAAQIERRNEARDFWRNEVMNGLGPADEAVKVFAARYRRAYRVPAFDDRGRGRRKGAWRLIAGSERNSLSDDAGSLGRLVVKLGLPLKSSKINFADISELADRTYDPHAQWDKDVRRVVARWVRRNVSGPSITFIERGLSGLNHLHVVHAPGACPLGRKSAIDTAKDLIDTGSYLSKKAVFNQKHAADEHENVVAFVEMSRSRGSTSSRVITCNLGSEKITLADVLAVMGPEYEHELLRVDKAVAAPVVDTQSDKSSELVEITVPVGHCGHPIPRIKASYEWSPIDQAATVIFRYKYLRSPSVKLPKRPLSFEPELEAYTWPKTPTEPQKRLWQPSEAHLGMSPPPALLSAAIPRSFLFA